MEHIHQLTTMDQTWDWETCRLWSERVFAMMEDGRPPLGWADAYAIKDVQRDAISEGLRLALATGQRATGGRDAGMRRTGGRRRRVAATTRLQIRL